MADSAAGGRGAGVGHPVDVLESRRLFAGYAVTDLTPAAKSAAAFDVSNNGTVALQYNGHAAIYKAGKVIDFGIPGFATGVNDSGTAIGVDTAGGGPGRPFIYSGGKETFLLPAGQYGSADAINDAGVVVGTVGGFSSSDGAGFYKLPGKPAVVTDHSDQFEGVHFTGINDNNVILGYGDNPGPGGPDVLLDNELVTGKPGLTTFPQFPKANAFGYHYSIPGSGLTDDGRFVVAGNTDDPNTGQVNVTDVFVYDPAVGAATDRGRLAGSEDISVDDLNASGVAAVTARLPNASQGVAAVSAPDAPVQDLNTLIDPGQNWTLEDSNGINDAGQIVGGGTHNGVEHAFLLTPFASGSISGTVYNDNNGNGGQDAGEPVSGVRTVFLDLNGNNTLDANEPHVQTNGKGQYGFNGLAAGTYRVERVLPAGYHLSNGTGGGKAVVVTLTSGQKAQNVVLGSAPNAAPPATASITGTLFEDADADGVFDPGEARTGVRTVFLDTNRNGRPDDGEASVQSRSDGTYAFANLAAGTYYVARVFPAGYKLTNNAAGYLTITVGVGQARAGVDLGTHQA